MVYGKAGEMNSFLKSIGIVWLSASIAGCSSMSSLLDPKGGVPQASTVQTGNALAMPPDLQLPAPGQTTDAYQPNGAVAAPAKIASAPLQGAADAPMAPMAVKQDLYAEYGINKLDANGKPKDIWKLKAELKAAILKKKRETNPGYGTVANIGAIFSDQ